MKQFQGVFAEFAALPGALCVLQSAETATFYKLPEDIARKFFGPYDQQVVGLEREWWDELVEVTRGRDDCYQYSLYGEEDLVEVLGINLEEHYVGAIDYFIADLL